LQEWALLAEQAGELVSHGKTPLLDMVPRPIHERTSRDVDGGEERSVLLEVPHVIGGKGNV